MGVLIRATLEGDRVCRVAVLQIIEWSQTVKSINLCEIVIGDLVSLILNSVCLILFSLNFMLCAPVFVLWYSRWQLTQL